MPKTLITTLGENKITEARDNGLYVDVMYYVPVYDSAVPENGDPDISTFASVSNTVPSGDVWWNIPYNVWVGDTHYDGIDSYDDVISAVYGNSIDVNNPTIGMLYSGVSYKPLIDGGAIVGGTFTTSVRIPKGTIVFSKIGLYGVLKDSTGSIVSSPFLFAVTLLPHAKYVVTLTSATLSDATEVRFDTNIAITNAVTVDGQLMDIEYWGRKQWDGGLYGLHYSGNVFIGNSLGVEDTSDIVYPIAKDIGVSKLLVSTYKRINKIGFEDEALLPQLGLQNVSIDEDHVAHKRRVLFRVTDTGDLEIDFYGACGEDIYSMSPNVSRLVSLGTSQKRWYNLYLKYGFDITNDSYSARLYESNDGGGVLDLKNVSLYLRSSTSENSHYYYGNVSNYDGTDLLVKSDKGIYVVAIGNINNWSPTSEDIMGEIDNMCAYGESFNPSNVNTITGFSSGSSGNSFFDNMLMGGTVIKSSSDWGYIRQLYDDHSGGNDIYLMSSKKIYTFGDIVPTIARTFDIGSENRRYRSMSTQKIVGYRGTKTNQNRKYLTIDGDLIPSVDSVSDFGSSTNRWNEIYAKSCYAELIDCQTLSVRYFNVSGSININNGNLVIDGNKMYTNNEAYSIGESGNLIPYVFVDELHVKSLIPITN